MSEFCALASTGGVGWDSEGEDIYVTRESEVRALVAAIENGRAYDAVAIVKRQPWFGEVRRGIRATRHLKPSEYMRISDRSDQLPPL